MAKQTTEPYTKVQNKLYLFNLLCNGHKIETYYAGKFKYPALYNLIEKLSDHEVVLLTDNIENKL